MLPLLRPPVFGCVWGALCLGVRHPAPSSVAMATISSWKRKGSGVGAPSGFRLTKRGESWAPPLGVPPRVCNWGNTATLLEASPYWTPMWASSTPMELPLVCPPSAPLPARTPPRFGAPSPARPLAAPPIGPASGPAPRPSSLGLGLSRVLAARRAPGRPRDGQQRARPEGPGPDLQAEIRGVSASGSPSAPRPGVPWVLSPSLPPSRPPWRGGPLRSPPPALLSGQASHPPGTAPARFCLASAPPPPASHSGRSLELGKTPDRYALRGPLPRLAPSPSSSPTSRGRSQAPGSLLPTQGRSDRGLRILRLGTPTAGLGLGFLFLPTPPPKLRERFRLYLFLYPSGLWTPG